MRKSLWRGLLAGVVGLLALAGIAHADTSSSLTIVGTSDVSDSGLIQNLVQPGFENAYPQFTFKYVGSATGTAIQSAETGVNMTAGTGPSVLIVHAASLENQFVAPAGTSTPVPTVSSGPASYSYNGQYGNAIFRNDFILAGSTADSVGVNAAAPHNIAAAFAQIASAGAAGNAEFFTRGGGSTASGTVVEEHAIWALVYADGLTPSNVSLCTVSAGDGGGMSPVSPTLQATSGQPCPQQGNAAPVTTAQAPAWYDITGATTQAANVNTANSCTGAPANGNNCYVLTDRGTFDYLSQGGPPAAGQAFSPGPSVIANLKIVTRDNTASAPGGQFALVNYFHAYIVNPNVSGESVNLPAAQDFVNYLTSPSFQSEVGNYLNTGFDPGGAPFQPDASPIVTASGFPSSLTAGQPVTVTGSITNAEIGYPALSGDTVSVDEEVGGLEIPVSGATATTDANGNYSITFTPQTSGGYQVVTGQLSQVENASLSPIYGDILSSGASPTTQVTVNTPPTTTTVVTPGPTTTVTAPAANPVAATIKVSSAKGSVGYAKVSGSLTPGAPDANGSVAILARKYGSLGAYSEVGGGDLKQGQTTFAIDGTLGAGKWQVEARYSDPGKLTTVTSSASTVTVQSPITTAAFSKASAKVGKVTATGKLSQAIPRNATVELLAQQTAHLSGAKLSKIGSFKAIGKVTVKAGKSTFTVTGKLTRGYRYVLQLEYIQSGAARTYSKLANLSVS